MAWIIVEEHQILTRSLHKLPTFEDLFKRHRYEWMAQSPEKFHQEYELGVLYVLLHH